ncbi:MAG: YqgE/AlgH family protein [Ottowia sp.]|nr:YqgE/AlgH family protein [Ottowia sp.]
MQSQSNPINFTNQFLIAMPGVTGPLFAGSVVYVCEHNERGALGLVINRPTDINMATLFDKISLKLEIAPLQNQPVLYGGPVQVERGFVLHESREGTTYYSSLRVPGGLEMTTSKDVLEEVAAGTGPSRFLLTLGYAGWSAGQLENEVAHNGWLTVPANPSIIFDTPIEARQDAAMALLGVGVSLLTLSTEAGHG